MTINMIEREICLMTLMKNLHRRMMMMRMTLNRSMKMNRGVKIKGGAFCVVGIE